MLDAGPSGLLISPNAGPLGRQCRDWLARLEATSAEVILLTIVDFEVRRELLRLGATAKLRALDEFKARLDVVDVGERAFLRPAEFWATAQGGKAAATPEALDAEAIIAGIAAEIGGAWDEVIVATINIGHFGHFGRFAGIDARPWVAIV